MSISLPTVRLSFDLQIIGFGFILCFDSFLYTFTVLPIRAVIAFFRFNLNLFSWSGPPLPPAQKADLLRTLLLIATICILYPLADASKIYHFIRGQDTIKLYVIFNALEVRVTSLLSWAHSYTYSPISLRSRIDYVAR